jgi:hypothetical protein
MSIYDRITGAAKALFGKEKEKPAPGTKAAKWAEVHARALHGFRSSWNATWEQRRQSLEDRKFGTIAGAQWSGHAFELQFENKPRLEVNKVHLAVVRVINEYRNNRIDVLFAPKTGEKADKISDTCASLYRADMEDSLAEESFDTGFEEAALGGLGAWRLRAVYEDDEDADNDCQRMTLEPIQDADQLVFWDADCRTQDKSRCKRWWVLNPMTRDAYREEHDDDPATWPKESWNTDGFEWTTPDIVYVAEYYELEETKDTVEIWEQPATGEQVRKIKSKLDSQVLEEGEMSAREQLEASGYVLIDEKRTKRRRIHKWLMSGNGVLEDCKYLPGKIPPVITVFGKHWVVDNREHWQGHVRLAKDAQRLKNVMLSKLAEIAGKSSVPKPILHPEEIAGHQKMWSEDNIKDYPYALINPLRDVSGNPLFGRQITNTQPPSIPEALAALLQITEQDLKDILGNQQEGEQLQPNVSGKLMEMIQDKLDMQAFVYIDNMKKSVRWTGQAWLSAAKEIYVEEGRKMKGVDRKGEPMPITIGQETVTKDGARVAENDITGAELEARVEVGPTTASRRKAIVNRLMTMIQFVDDPEDRKVILAMAFANMEGEGLQDVRQYFRKRMVRMGIVEPTKEEAADLAKEQQSQKPDPNEVYLLGEAERAQAEAMEKRANVVLKVEQANKAKAETAEIVSNIDQQQQDQAFEIIDRVAPKLTAAAEQPPAVNAPETAPATTLRDQ